MQPGAGDTDVLDADQLNFWLEEAGEALMRLPSKGCFPATYRSGMPEYIHLPGDAERYRENPYLSASRADRQRPGPPTGQQLSVMDHVYLRWVPLLPLRTDVDIRRRRIVLYRSLVFPDAENDDRRHVWPWRRLGDLLNLDHHTVKLYHSRAIDELLRRLRSVPAPCSQTMRRIAAHKFAVDPARSQDSPIAK